MTRSIATVGGVWICSFFRGVGLLFPVMGAAASFIAGVAEREYQLIINVY